MTAKKSLLWMLLVLASTPSLEAVEPTIDFGFTEKINVPRLQSMLSGKMIPRDHFIKVFSLLNDPNIVEIVFDYGESYLDKDNWIVQEKFFVSKDPHMVKALLRNGLAYLDKGTIEAKFLESKDVFMVETLLWNLPVDFLGECILQEKFRKTKDTSMAECLLDNISSDILNDRILQEKFLKTKDPRMAEFLLDKRSDSLDESILLKKNAVSEDPRMSQSIMRYLSFYRNKKNYDDSGTTKKLKDPQNKYTASEKNVSTVKKYQSQFEESKE